MAKDNKITLPFSQGGLNRVFSESRSLLQFGPDKVLFASVLLAALIFLLHIL